MPGKKHPEKARLRRRWRLLRALALTGLILTVLLSVAATVAYQRRVRIINHYLATSGLPFEVTVGTLEVQGLSFFSLDKVELRLPGTEKPFLSFSSSAANLSVPDLLEGHIADLHIDNANVHVDDALFKALTDPRPNPKNASAKPAATLLISQLDLHDAHVTLALTGHPIIEFDLDHHGETIQIAGGLPTTGRQQLELSDINVGFDGNTHLNAPSLSLSFTSGGDSGGLHISSLELDSPTFTLTQQLLDRILPAPQPDTPSKPSTPLPFPITLDALAIKNLQLTTPAGLQLPVDLPYNLPEGTVALSVTGGHINLDTRRALTAAPQKITATADFGPLLNIRTLDTSISATASVPTIDSLRAETHIDLPATDSLPSIAAHINLTLAALTLAPDGPTSTSTQSLSITDLSTSHGTSNVTMTSLATTLRPDTLRAEKRLDTLHINDLHLHIDPATLPTLPNQSPDPDPAPATQPLWHGLSITDLSLTGGTLIASPTPDLGIPGITANLNIATTATTGTNSTYRTDITRLRLHSTDDTLATARTITLNTDPTTLWSDNRITSLTIDGLNLTAGQALIDATTPTAKSTPTSGDTTTPSESQAWTLGQLDITQSTIVIDDLVPGLPPLPLSISTTLTDIPLGTSSMDAATRPQSVTVSNARLRSRLNPLIDVARFEDVTLHFNFRDLVQQKIDRITIDRPVIFVGEHLFWYVDYFRKFEAPATGAIAGTEETKKPGWDVRTVEALNGELVLAPKGAPLTELPKLPFSGTTRIVDSQLSFALDPIEGESEDISEKRPLLSLSVPEGDYPLKSLNLGLEVDLKGLRGEIAFNLPIAQRTNNLVQTLYADEVWFKDLNAQDVYLAVTYDQQGIYAQFGGKAYGGYAEGAFNLYSDDAYSWDGWVTGTAVGLGPLTAAITPEYLEMTGTADAKLIAQGNFQSFDDVTATGSIITAQGGGKIDILALGDLGESLVEDSSQIAAAFTTAGINVIRYFDYDTAKIDLDMFGREGDVNLHLSGPSGLRQINITAHDYRNKITTTP